MTQALSGTSRSSRQQLKLINCATDSPPVAVCEGLAGEFSRELATLLRAAGANIALQTSHAGREADIQRHGFLLRKQDNPSPKPPVALYPLNGLRGVLKGFFPELSLLVAGVSRTTPRAADAVADLAGKLLGAEPRVAAIGCDAMLPALRDNFPGVRTLAPEAAIDTLLSAGASLDLLVMDAGSAVVLSRFAAGIAGSRQVGVVLSEDSDGLRCEHRAPAGEPVDPAAVVFAAARLLQAAGQLRAAGRLQDAALKTLEDGVHTEALATVVPYSTRVVPGRMIEEIGKRLGQTPRRLAAARLIQQEDKTPPLRRVL